MTVTLLLFHLTIDEYTYVFDKRPWIHVISLCAAGLKLGVENTRVSGVTSAGSWLQRAAHTSLLVSVGKLLCTKDSFGLQPSPHVVLKSHLLTLSVATTLHTWNRSSSTWQQLINEVPLSITMILLYP